MKVRLLFVVLLLGAAAREQLKNFSSNQDKYLEMHVKLRESEPSQRILNGNASQQDSINMFIIENKLTSNNKDIWRHERGLPRSNNRELEKNHDYGFEYKTDLYESDGKQKARLLNYKNVRRKKNALNELEKESMKYQELKNHENVQSPPSTSENLNETSLAQDEAAQNSRVDDLNEGGLEKYRPNPSSVAHQEDENVSLEEVEAHPVNARRTSASPQKDDFNDTLSTLSLKKTDAETCRFGMHIGQELSLNGDNYGRITCFMCYLVIPKHRKKIELQLEYSTHTFSYENRTKEPFDPSSSVSWAIIRGSLISDVEADKLENCCAEATDCCSTISQETTGTPDAEGDFCPATWDGWSCFSVPVPAGMTVPVKCPVHAYSGYPECYLYGKKTCMPNGTWFKNGIHEYTDYSLCSMESYHSFLYFWELAVHSASILVLLPALVVLLSYRSLQKPWFHMLLNFYIALLLRSLMTIIELSVIKIPENKHISTIMEDNGVGCKIVASLRLASLLSVWVWMLANSVFLYRSVARALSRTTNIKIYYFTAWGCTVLLTAVWVTCKALLEDYQCWLGDVKEDRYKLYLIKDIPIILSLAISLGLLSHLACLVFSNMRGRSESIKEDNKKAFKATVFLVPMFGLQFFLSVVVYTEVECTRLQVNLCFATALTGLQGLYASVIYCFMNAEVKRELQKTLNSLAARLCPRRDEAMYPQSSVGPQTTYSTVQADTQADTSPVETTELVALNSNMQTTR